MSSTRDPAGPDRPSTESAGEPLVSPVGGSGAGNETSPAGTAPTAGPGRPARESHNMLPPRDRRRLGVERILVRLIATGGIVGIGVAIGAVMVSNNAQGWIVGLVVSIVSVVLAAILWSSRQL